MVLLVGKMQITAVKIRPAFSRTSDARHSVPRRVAVRSEYSSGPSSSSQTPGGSPTPEFGSQAAIPPPSDRFSSGSNEPIGSKLQKWMENPLTFLAMGPRAGLGALTSATEVVNRIPELQAEFEERMNFVINDPRPVSEKQEAIAKELESTLAELISTGEKVETDVLSQLSAQLPPEVLDAIPKDLKDAFPGLQPITEADPFSGEWEVAADETFTYSPGTNYEDPKPSSGSAPSLPHRILGAVTLSAGHEKSCCSLLSTLLAGIPFVCSSVLFLRFMRAMEVGWMGVGWIDLLGRHCTL
uniref:Uncharacterized protein n=1 Tax=Tetraselmis sp. GSL018 TaxID=582737 RepID=A0A061SCV7_9CHLO